MNFLNKLTSRKFWVAVTNFVAQLLYFFNFAETEVEKVTALIMASAGLIAYIIGEGLADSCDTTVQNYEQQFPMNPPEEKKNLSKKEGTISVEDVMEKTTLYSMCEQLVALEKRVKVLEDILETYDRSGKN